jgi:hypothetical protein
MFDASAKLCGGIDTWSARAATAIPTAPLELSAERPFTTSFASQKILSENDRRGYCGLLSRNLHSRAI